MSCFAERRDPPGTANLRRFASRRRSLASPESGISDPSAVRGSCSKQIALRLIRDEPSSISRNLTAIHFSVGERTFPVAAQSA